MREEIRDFNGKVVGYINHQSNGDLEVRDFNGVVLGYYRKSSNRTTNFHGVVLAQGNVASGFLLNKILH